MNVYNSPIITPENLVDITIQYRLPSGGSPSNAPTVFLRYGLINIQQKRISLAEIKPYIGYLQIRAAVEAKSVIATQFTNFKTVIGVGEPESGFNQLAQLSNGGDPCAESAQVVYLSHAAPFVPGDTIYADPDLSTPLTGFTLISNYTTGLIYAINTLSGVVGAATGASCVVPPVPATPATVTLKLDGVNFTAPRALIGSIDCTITGLAQVDAVDLPAVCFFKLPKRTDTFYVDYNVAAPGLSTFVDAFENTPGVWDVYLTMWSAIGGVFAVDFQAQDLVQINNVNNGTPFTGMELSFYTQDFTKLTALSYPQSGFDSVWIVRPTQIFPFVYTHGDRTGVYDVTLFDSSGTPITTLLNVYNSQQINIAPTITRVDFVYKPLVYKNNVVGSANNILVADSDGTYWAFALIGDESGTAQNLRYAHGGGANVAIITLNPALLPFNASAYKNGVLVVPVTAVTTQLFNLAQPDLNWDTLVLGSAAPPAVPGITAIVSNSLVNFCANPTGTVYTSTGAITPGLTVYSDSALSVPLTGFDFIQDQAVGIVFNMNSLTAVVGSNTGQSC